MADPSRMELVIVAIPREDDHVFKVSSEKVPHMTLLYLGEVQWTAEQAINVTQYVEHAASLLRRFWMSVDHRGTLGPEQADVLFFDKNTHYKRLMAFRDNLMVDRDINTAYHATTQYPQWTPHLTLGYPETPAKPDTRDYGFNGVEFDKIAIWFGDSEGPTFQLKSWDDTEPEVAMTQTQAGIDFLEHHGVKGMKWGVRRAEKRAAKADRKWENSIYTVHGAIAVHNEMANRMNNGEIDKHNNNPKWKGVNLRENPKMEKAYYKAYEKLSDKVYAEAVTAVHGTSPSGRKKAVYVNDSDGPRIEIRDADAQHADNSAEPDLVIRLRLNALGQVIEENEASGTVAHSEVDSFLEHYGVKGMKWGVHKDHNAAGRKQTEATSSDAKKLGDVKNRVGAQKTTRILSNQELRDALDRMRLEQEFTKLTNGLDKTKREKAAKFVSKLLIDTSKQNVEQTVKTQASGFVNEAIKNAKK